MVEPVAFEQAMPLGLCVGVRIPPDDNDAVAPERLGQLAEAEARHATGLPRPRRITWVAGRLALRAALGRFGEAAGTRLPAAIPPVLPNGRGAPTMPPGLVGSISHTRTMAVALVAEDTGWAVGVDIERFTMRSRDISRHILTDDELAEIAALPAEQRDAGVMTRFSLKESIYKAIDPFLHRFVGFHEVHATPLDDGRARVLPRLRSGGPLEICAWWQIYDAFVLTCARARPM